MNTTVELKGNKAAVSKETLGKLIDRRVLGALEVCVRCGICTESCHFYRSDPKVEYTPFYRAEQVRQLYRYLNDPLGRLAPRWVNAKAPTDESLSKLAETAFATCTLCHRCTLECPFGVETAEIMRVARSLATAAGQAPEMLVELANAAIAKGENPDFFRDFYLEQVKGLEEEVQDKLGSSKATFPWEKKELISSMCLFLELIPLFPRQFFSTW